MIFNEDNNLVIAVMQLEGIPQFLRKGMDDRHMELYHNNALAICELFDDNTDSIVVVVDESDNVCDIRKNDLSIGYFPTRTICQTLGISMAPLVMHGEFDKEDLAQRVTAIDAYVQIVPLFGEVEVSDEC
jgi:hypothetical protein